RLTVRFPVETLFVLPWNRRSLCRGIRVRFRVESAFVLPWNIQYVSPEVDSVLVVMDGAAAKLTELQNATS
ncbi:hypothetical protein, partial [Paraburkholderia caribensis]|uniref:hypothetical protein n=1 Tax=Paraburkholderia caribensis TaxID=75105 RepID=UPI00209080C9